MNKAAVETRTSVTHPSDVKFLDKKGLRRQGEENKGRKRGG